MPPTRRTFLQAAAAGAVVLPVEARADAGRLHEILHGITGRAADARQAFLSGVDTRDTALAPHTHALAEAFAALSTLKEIEAMPVADQVHPRAQGLIADAVAAVGFATATCSHLLAAFLESPHPEREARMRTGLANVRAGVGDWPTDAPRRNAVTAALLEVEADAQRGMLLHRVRHTLRRLQKAERFGAELEARGGDPWMFAVKDPAVLEQVAIGQARWAGEAALAPPTALSAEGGSGGMSRGAAIALGIVVLSVGGVVGGILVVVGLCSALCGYTNGLVFLLLGLVIVGLAVWGGITLIRMGRSKSTAAIDGEVAPRRVVRAEAHVAVSATAGWVDAGIAPAEASTLLVRGTGLVRLPSHWMTDADGDGDAAGPDALVPDAPLGALVGRIGETAFFVGAEGVVPEGLDGRLELAVNRRAAEAPRGWFAASISLLAAT